MGPRGQAEGVAVRVVDGGLVGAEGRGAMRMPEVT